MHIRNPLSPLLAQTPVPITIAGAQGRNAGIINGNYDPTEESTGDMPVYAKRGGGVWLEYWAPTKRWIVRTTEFRGTDKGQAKLLHPDWARTTDLPRLPHLAKGVWNVTVAAGTYEDQPSVCASEVSPPAPL